MGVALIILLLSIIGVVLEIAVCFALGLGASLSGNTGAVSDLAVVFICLMVFTGAIGILSPVCSLIELLTKKENISYQILLPALGALVICLTVAANVNRMGAERRHAEWTSTASGGHPDNGLTAMTADTSKHFAQLSAYDGDEKKLPCELKWNPYLVRIDQGAGESHLQRLQIVDDQNKVVREFRFNDGFIIRVRFREMDGEGDPELDVLWVSRGSSGMTTEYFFTHDGGLRNILILDGALEGADESGSKAMDLNGDGKLELIICLPTTVPLDRPDLPLGDDLAHAYEPAVTAVVGWTGGRYEDQTRLYPQFTRKAALDYRKQLMRSAPDADDQNRRGGALGYYVNSLAIGKGPEAWAWMQNHAPHAIKRWLRRNQQLKAITVPMATLQTSDKLLMINGQ